MSHATLSVPRRGSPGATKEAGCPQEGALSCSFLRPLKYCAPIFGPSPRQAVSISYNINPVERGSISKEAISLNY